uniref:Terminase n=1 Tax=viral metagenome TaxID=1070528 RepID=A0A6M3INQ5_9ZZZZ
MPKQVDKLKKERYKQARLKGNSIVGSLEVAGYAPSSARMSSHLEVSKQGEAELMVQVKSSDITVDWVVNQLTKELVAKDAKASDRIRVSELLGKYLNMFKDANPVNIGIFNGLSTKDLDDLPKTVNITPDIDSKPLTQPPDNVGVSIV